MRSSRFRLPPLRAAADSSSLAQIARDCPLNAVPAETATIA